MKVVTIADEIVRENSLKESYITSVSYWLRANCGKLNLLLYEDFYIDPVTLDIFKKNGNPCEIHKLAVAIFKLMYRSYYFDLQISNTIFSMNENSILSASDEDFKVTKINRSEVLKTLAQLKKDTETELKFAVHYYRSNYGIPRGVSGDDFVEGHYNSVYSHGYKRDY